MTSSNAHQAYCGVILIGHLDRLKKSSLKVAESSEDVEDLHRARVATRRIRSVLVAMSAFSKDEVREWDRSFRGYGRDLGAARDLDVRVEFISEELKRSDGDKGLARLLLRLTQERARIEPSIAARARDCLSWDVWSDLPQKLKPIMGHHCLGGDQPFPEKIALAQIEKLVVKVAGNDPFVKNGYDRDLWHSLRKDGKRLRYTLELYNEPLGGKPFDRWLEILKELQGRLGMIHDLDLWTESLPSFIQVEMDRTMEFLGHTKGVNSVASGIEALCQKLKERLIEEIDLFMPYWDGLVRDRTWSELTDR